MFQSVAMSTMVQSLASAKCASKRPTFECRLRSGLISELFDVLRLQVIDFGEVTVR